MSATLNWQFSGLQAKTGTTIGAWFTDMRDMFLAKDADSAYSWRVAASNVGSNPYWINLKPKSGGAGRILFLAYTSTPSTHATMFDTTPGLNGLFAVFFPNGNVDTPSNLTSGSGTIMGNDANAVKATFFGSLTFVYITGRQCYYFDSSETIGLFFGNPSTIDVFGGLIGYPFVDTNDNVYAGSYGGANSTWATPTWPGSWTTAPPNSGGGGAYGRVNYPVANDAVYLAFSPAGNWTSLAPSATDKLTDNANSYVWFCPVQLLNQRKGDGFLLKFRQFVYGPGTVVAFSTYNTTGPVLQARQLCQTTTGSVSGNPWFVNFKI